MRSQKLGNLPSLFLSNSEVAWLASCDLCVGQEGLYTSLKPEEALIYLYDGRTVGMSDLGSVQVMASLCASYGVAACEDNPTIRPSQR